MYCMLSSSRCLTTPALLRRAPLLGWPGLPRCRTLLRCSTLLRAAALLDAAAFFRAPTLLRRAALLDRAALLRRRPRALLCPATRRRARRTLLRGRSRA